MFDQILVTNDGDSAGAGELYIRNRVHQTEATKSTHVNHAFSGRGWLNPRCTMTVDNTPRSFQVYTRIAEDDWNPGDTCNSMVPRSWGRGSNSCWDWATAAATITLPTNGVSGSGTFTASVNAALGFQITGTWSVKYQA